VGVLLEQCKHELLLKRFLYLEKNFMIIFFLMFCQLFRFKYYIAVIELVVGVAFDRDGTML